MEELIFVFFAGITAAFAFLIGFTRNLMYAILLLFLVLFGVAALFVFAHAEFLAVSQLIVYIGGVLILMVFGVMLTRRSLDENPKTDLIQILPSMLIAGTIVSGLMWLILSTNWENIVLQRQTTETTPLSNIQLVGKQVLTDYLLPFELASVLLLAAMIGAGWMARTAEEEV